MASVYSHERLNFPVSGSEASTIHLPECDLWSHIPIQDSIQDTILEIVYCPSSNLLATSPCLEFKVKPSVLYSDLADSFLTMELSLTKNPDKSEGSKDTAVITDEDKVGTCNFIGACMFKDLAVQMAGKPINSCFNNFYWENYIKVVTEASYFSMDKWKPAGLYKQIDYSQIAPVIDGGKSGDKEIAWRYRDTGKGKRFFIRVPLMVNICAQSRLIPSLTELSFVYTKNDAAFKVCHPASTKATFDIEIHQAYLTLKRCKLYPSLETQLNTKLANGAKMRYFFENSYARNFTILAGQTTARIPDILLQSYLPNYLYITILEEKDYRGSTSSQNLAFSPHHVNELSLRSGNLVWPKDGVLKPDYAAGNCQRSFFSLLGSTFGLAMKADYAPWLTSDKFEKYHCIYKFDMSRYNNNLNIVGETFLDQRQACSSLDIHISFAQQTSQNLVILVFTSYVESLSISSNSESVRDVELGFSI